MEGAGNDFIFINLFEEIVFEKKALAQEMTHRRFGIGGDGLIFIAPSETADVRMIIHNIDGSEAEMCGNGIRCVGKYAHDNGLVSGPDIRVETGAGIKPLHLITGADGCVNAASVEMGVPVLQAAEMPSTLSGEQIVDQHFNFKGFSLQGTLVSMGNPHFVTFVEDVARTPVAEWGPVVENDARFPRRINVEFVQVVSRSEVIQRTWERGCGETWACGTGASAVCVAGRLTGRTEASILNHLKGGDLTLTWAEEGQQVVMTGPARAVFTGTWRTNLF